MKNLAFNNLQIFSFIFLKFFFLLLWFIQHNGVWKVGTKLEIFQFHRQTSFSAFLNNSQQSHYFSPSVYFKIVHDGQPIKPIFLNWLAVFQPSYYLASEQHSFLLTNFPLTSWSFFFCISSLMSGYPFFVSFGASPSLLIGILQDTV